MVVRLLKATDGNKTRLREKICRYCELLFEMTNLKKTDDLAIVRTRNGRRGNMRAVYYHVACAEKLHIEPTAIKNVIRTEVQNC